MVNIYRETYISILDSNKKSYFVTIEEKSKLNEMKHRSLTLINHSNEHLEREILYKDQQIQAIYNTIG